MNNRIPAATFAETDPEECELPPESAAWNWEYSPPACTNTHEGQLGQLSTSWTPQECELIRETLESISRGSGPFCRSLALDLSERFESGGYSREYMERLGGSPGYGYYAVTPFDNAGNYTGGKIAINVYEMAIDPGHLAKVLGHEKGHTIGGLSEENNVIKEFYENVADLCYIEGRPIHRKARSGPFGR